VPAELHRLVFESFGVAAEVVTDDPELLGALPRILPPDWSAARGDAAASFALVRDMASAPDEAEVVPVGNDTATSLARLGAAVRHRVALLAPGHVFIHAGVVSWDGACILLPGSPHSGKSTLVAALLGEGATYHSDEYAPVGAGGLVEPYAKPLSIRVPGRHGPGELTPVPPEQIATEPARADFVVLTAYAEGAAWRPAARSAGEGAMALLEHTVPARSKPEQALAVVSRLAREAEILSSPRGEARDVAPALLAAVSGKSTARMGY
jgi:hypothetical protein